MKTLSFVPLALIVYFCTVESLPFDNRIKDEEIRFAGSTEGKTFYAVRNATHLMNWHDAGRACNDLGMQFAELTTRNQVMVIHDSAKAGLIDNGIYWVGARDAWKPRQFSWNSTDVDFTESEAVLTGRSLFLEPLTCVYMYTAAPRTQPEFYLIPCATAALDHRLCQVNSTLNF